MTSAFLVCVALVCLGAASGGVAAEGARSSVRVFGGVSPRRPWGSKPLPANLRMGFESGPVEGATPEVDGILVDLVGRGASLASSWPQRCSLKTLYEGEPETECATALVGRGAVVSDITVGDGDEAPVRVAGRLKAYASDGGGSEKILARIVTGEPLPLVYVIPFAIERRQDGITRLTVSPRRMHRVLGRCARGHPHCLGPNPYTLEGIYSHISRFEMALHRVVRRRGSRLSFVRGGCTPPLPDVANMMRIRLTFSGATASEGKVGPECRSGVQRVASSQASTVSASLSGGKTG